MGEDATQLGNISSAPGNPMRGESAFRFCLMTSTRSVTHTYVCECIYTHAKIKNFNSKPFCFHCKYLICHSEIVTSHADITLERWQIWQQCVLWLGLGSKSEMRLVWMRCFLACSIVKHGKLQWMANHTHAEVLLAISSVGHATFA